MKPKLASELLINPSFSPECLFAESRTLLNTEIFAKGGDPKWNDWTEEKINKSLEEYKIQHFRGGIDKKTKRAFDRADKMLKLYFKGKSLQKIGKKFKVSKQRVYQILSQFPEYIEKRRF